MKNHLMEIRESILELLPKAIPGASTYPFLQPIDENIWQRVEPFSEDKYQTGDIEQLLLESTTLMDRCYEHRQKKIELETSAVEFWLEYHYYLKGNEVVDRQISNGLLTRAKDLAEIRVKYTEQILAKQQLVKTDAKQRVLFESTGNAQLEERIELAAETTKLSAGKPTKALKKVSRELFRSRSKHEKLSSDKALKEAEAQILLSELAHDTSQNELSFEEKNIIELNELRRLEREYREQLAMIFSAQGGALDHAKRLESVQDTFDEDIRSLLVRLSLIQKTLSSYFSISTSPPPDGHSSDTLDTSSLWLRKAVELYSQYSSSVFEFSLELKFSDFLNSNEIAQLMDKGVVDYSINTDALSPVKQCHFESARINLSSVLARKIKRIILIRPEIDTASNLPLVFGSFNSRNHDDHMNSVRSRFWQGTPVIGKWQMKIVREKLKTEDIEEFGSGSLTLNCKASIDAG